MWQVLNKRANPKDARFTDTFLVVTPGITIRDRLRVLLPSDPGNYYRALDLVPPDLMDKLGQAKIIITNYHTIHAKWQATLEPLREKLNAALGKNWQEWEIPRALATDDTDSHGSKPQPRKAAKSKNIRVDPC